MIALQYIYTSWRNGESTDKGFMIYSKSAGITDEECDDIRFVMQYVVPKEMMPNPTEQEILDNFPYSFAYFKLSSGRACVAQSTYLGKDYSGRYGNYIIYALVCDMDELDVWPVEFFAEDYMKTFMTEDELNATPPVPQLPNLNIDDFGNVINDDQIMEFLFDKEDEFSYLISAVFEAQSYGVPFYLNDTRENLVMWMAALQKMMPLSIAKKITFNTYVGNHEKFRMDSCKEKGLNLMCYGVRPDANYFNYLSGSKSSQQVVMDFLGGYMTENIVVCEFAKAMASSYTLGMDEIYSFSNFIEEIGYISFDINLNAAYLIYALLKNDELLGDESKIIKCIDFSEKYCSKEMCGEIGAKLIDKLHNDFVLKIDTQKKLIPYLYKYSNFMMFSIHDILYNTIFDFANESSSECLELDELLYNVKNNSIDGLKDFIHYFETDDVVNQTVIYLDGNYNKYANLFYIKFVFTYYQFNNGLSTQKSITKLAKLLLNNLSETSNNSDIVILLLDLNKDSIVTMVDILEFFLCKYDNEMIKQFGSVFGKWLDNISEVTAQELQKAMINNSNMSKFAVYLSSMYIFEAKEPAKAFWNLYNGQYAYLEGVDVGLMVAAYLIKTDNPNELIKVLEGINEDAITHPQAADVMVELFNKIPIKNIFKMKSGLMFKLLDICKKNNYHDKINKLVAVSVTLIIKRDIESRQPNQSVSKLLEVNKVSLEKFDKKDYQEYADESVSIFLDSTNDAKDFKSIVYAFYNTNYFKYFNEEVVEYLKQLEKKNIRKWTKLVSIICLYLVENEGKEKEADSYFKLISKYFRKHDPEFFEEVKENVTAEAKYGVGDFFDRIYEKESFGDKLGGLFRKSKF